MKTTAIFAAMLLICMSVVQEKITAQCVQCSGGTASGNAASIIGLNNTASGSYSFAGGVNSLASGGVSFAFGGTASANASYSVAIGTHATANYSKTFAIGSYCTADATNSYVIGTGQTESLKLSNTIPYSIMMGIGSTKPTFFVGPSNGLNSTGKIGIGDVTSPESKLHIKADNGEAAEVFIEPHQFSGSSGATLWLGTKDYGIRSRWGKLEFKVGNNGSYLFNEGKIGIGTPNPTARLQIKDGDIFIEDIDRGIIMKSPDGQCWRGKLDNTGSLHFEPIDCGTLVGIAAEPGSRPSQQVRIYPNPAGEEINIEYTRSGLAFVTIRDLNGALILNQELKAGVNRIGMQNLSTGYYLVSVMDRNNRQLAAEKILKH